MQKKKTVELISDYALLPFHKSVIDFGSTLHVVNLDILGTLKRTYARTTVTIVFRYKIPYHTNDTY